MNLYLTQDRIGTPTGGGAVTYHEYKALESLGGETHPIDAGRVQTVPADPFANDTRFMNTLALAKDVKLVHIYAGCFTNTVKLLKEMGVKIAYTAAAHDIGESRKEFEGLGIPFNLPHLTQPDLWEQYVGGYRNADLVICPSTLSKKCMESYGCKNVSVISHGCEIPATVAPLPKRFTVGYLGQAGPDKGLRYLFAAWKKLALKDATLVIAGNNVDQAMPLWRQFGGGNVEFMGFVNSVSEFYNKISIYVQPSVTEGFGIEVLEAMAHGRPVICSSGAGAVDALEKGGCGFKVAPRDIEGLASVISTLVDDDALDIIGEHGREGAKSYTWDKVRVQYQAAWKELLK